MEKYIDAMIRQNLMQRQAERKKVDEIDIRQFPELTVNWVSGHKLRTETVWMTGIQREERTSITPIPCR